MFGEMGIFFPVTFGGNLSLARHIPWKILVRSVKIWQKSEVTECRVWLFGPLAAGSSASFFHYELEEGWSSILIRRSLLNWKAPNRELI